MKKISFLMAIAVFTIVASCNNQSTDKNKSKEMKMDEMKMDRASHKQHQVMDSSMKK